MRYTEREKINITPESKVFISLGDSFVEGQGALSSEVWSKYNWDKNKLLEEYPKYYDDYYSTEIENSFTSVITREYLKDFIPINLGFRGRGLRNATKNLTSLNLDLKLETAKEIVVLVAATQFSRFDFLRGHRYDSHFNFFTVWPHQADPNNHPPGEVRLWEGYATEVHNDTTEVIEFLMNINEIKTWCKLYNAKLILTSACEYRFTEEYINNILTDTPEDFKNLYSLRQIIDWDKDVWYPKGYSTFTDLLAFYENKPEFIGNENWFPWAENYVNSNDGYFTPCAHPTIKGHQVIAKHLFEENFLI